MKNNYSRNGIYKCVGSLLFLKCLRYFFENESKHNLDLAIKVFTIRTVRLWYFLYKMIKKKVLNAS